jgi:hypothetical protein
VHPEHGSIILASADTRGLRTFGALLKDIIVLGQHLNLLAVKFNRLGIPVGIVVPQFYLAFLETRADLKYSVGSKRLGTSESIG